MLTRTSSSLLILYHWALTFSRVSLKTNGPETPLRGKSRKNV